MEPSHELTSNPSSWAERFALLLDEQRDRADRFLTARQEQFRNAATVLQEQFHRMEAELGASREQMRCLGEERDALKAQLESALPSVGSSNDEAMERRLQTASEELREANEKIVELQEQLTKARSSAAKLAQRSHEPGWFDWEAEKRRILAALEADAEGEDATQKRERLGIEEVLRMNDAVIAMKDREIQELKRGLDSRGNGPMTEESALRQAVNADVAIQEERARLQQLQKEWREKLRQAEVELSLERAKIARERAELDEQLRSMTDSRGKIAADVVAQDSAEHGSSGRWLAQLGLTAADREPTRH